MNKKILKAFTLAEVLITLTIIGVIAALTIPNLMQSYKKHEVEVKVKEAYSILSNITTMRQHEYGPLDDIFPPNTWAGYQGAIQGYFTDTYIKPYLKVTKDYYNPYGKNYNYKAMNLKLSDGYMSTSSFRYLLLDNGMLLGISHNPQYQNYTRAIIYVIDINGIKGKNQFGNDVFFFSQVKDTDKIFGGFTNSTISTSSFNSNVNECTTYGRICAYVIQKNGWKIPDNYPVKKW